MKKTFTIFVLAFSLLLLASITTASPCQDILLPGLNCTLITPPITCTSYTYSIYNTTTRVVTNQNLSLMNDTLYSLSFNQTNPDGYSVVLCDNTTTQIIVKDGESDMTYGIIISIFLFFAFATFVCLWLAKEVWVKLVFTLVFNLLVTSLIFFARLFVQISNPTQTSLLSVLDNFYTISLVGYPVILMAIIGYAIYMLLMKGADKTSKFANTPWQEKFGKMGKGGM